MDSADMKKKKIRKIILLVLAAALILAAVLLMLSGRKNKRQNTQAAAGTVISTAAVERMDLSNSVSVTGSVESVDSRTVTCDLKDVKVDEVLVSVGEYVEEGQVIARFDAGDLQEELEKSRNNYTVNQQLDSIKSSPLDTYNETVEKAKKSYDSTETTYHTRAAEYSAAKEQYETAFAEALAAFGIPGEADDAQEQLDAAMSSLTQSDEEYQAKNTAVKSLESAEQNLSTVKNSFISAETAMINAQETYNEEIEKAKQTYDEAVISEQLISEDSDLEKIEEYEEQIAMCEVKAPFSGVISSIDVKEGDTFTGGTVFTMLDNEHFKVKASVDEYDINSIVPGQKAYVKTNATGDEELAATVTYVAVTASSGQQTTYYDVEITLDEAQELLRTGMTASVSIELEGAENVLAVPYDCVTTDADGKSTVTVVENEEQRIVEVTKGLETDYYVEISGEGITEGTQVLLPTALVNTGDFGDENFFFDSQDGGVSFQFDMEDGNAGGPGGNNMPGGGPSGGNGPGGGPN